MVSTKIFFLPYVSFTDALPTDTTAVDGAAESAPAVESVPHVEVSTAAALPKEPRAVVRSKKQTPPPDQPQTIQGDYFFFSRLLVYQLIHKILWCFRERRTIYLHRSC